jgi:replicative DNA helicase
MIVADAKRPDGATVSRLRAPPVNLEAETQLLGALLINNRVFDLVAEFLRPEHFAEEVHGRIFDVCSQLIGRGQIANSTTLKNFFEQDASLAEVGGAAYLGRIAGAVATVINARDHGRIIQDLYLRRQLIAVGEDIVARAHAHDLDTTAVEIAARASADLDNATSGVTEETEPRFISHYYQAALEAADAAWKSPDHTTGLTWGNVRLDKKTGGLHDGDLVIVAGRPSMGKSSLLRGVMRANAARWQSYARRNEDVPRDQRPEPTKADGGPVLLFTPEMSGKQQAQMDIAAQLGISSDRQRKGDFQPHEFNQMTHWAMEENDLPILMDETPSLTLAQLRQRARRAKRRHNIVLIGVDYLQLLTIDQRSDRKYDGRVQELTAITRGLKTLARSLGIPVVVLSQLSREVERREDKRPQLADLRESGSIEQDADVIGMIYRDEYYLEREEPQRRSTERQDAFDARFKTWADALDKCRGMAEVFFAKQRMGPIGKTVLGFDAERAKFDGGTT